MSKTLSNLVKILLALFVVSNIIGCAPKKAEVKKIDIKNVKVIKAEYSNIGINTEYSAKLKPANEVNISSKISGKVSQVNVAEGDQILKGQLLFTLETSDIESQKRQSEASLDSAQANLTRASDSNLKQQVIASENAIKQAKIAFDDAKDSYAKMTSLYSTGGVSKQVLDDSQTKLKLAQVQYDTANDNYNLLIQKIGPQSIEVATTQVNQAKATIDATKVQLDNTIITSPITGTISMKNVEVGEITAPTALAFTVIDTTSIIAEIEIPDNLVPKIKIGSSAKIVISALANKNIDGVIDSVSPIANTKTLFYTLKIKIPNNDGLIKPGMFARVIFPYEKKEHVLTLPNEALVVENGAQYVYQVENNEIKKIAVTIGLANDKQSEVIGIKEGSSIILEGQNFLNEGDKVNVIGG